MRRFDIEMTTRVTIDLDEKLFDILNDEQWKKRYGNFLSDEHAIVDHVTYNMHFQDMVLSEVYGFGDFPDEYAEIIGDNYDYTITKIKQEEDEC